LRDFIGDDLRIGKEQHRKLLLYRRRGLYGRGSKGENPEQNWVGNAFPGDRSPVIGRLLFVVLRRSGNAIQKARERIRKGGPEAKKGL